MIHSRSSNKTTSKCIALLTLLITIILRLDIGVVFIILNAFCIHNIVAIIDHGHVKLSYSPAYYDPIFLRSSEATIVPSLTLHAV